MPTVKAMTNMAIAGPIKYAMLYLPAPPDIPFVPDLVVNGPLNAESVYNLDNFSLIGARESS